MQESLTFETAAKANSAFLFKNSKTFGLDLWKFIFHIFSHKKYFLFFKTFYSRACLKCLSTASKVKPNQRSQDTINCLQYRWQEYLVHELKISFLVSYDSFYMDITFATEIDLQHICFCPVSIL